MLEGWQINGDWVEPRGTPGREVAEDDTHGRRGEIHDLIASFYSVSMDPPD